MNVAEFIVWLGTQDQSRTVKVLCKQSNELHEYGDPYDWEDFDPVLHSDAFFDGVLEIGSDVE